jgi:hypothetical protein
MGCTKCKQQKSSGQVIVNDTEIAQTEHKTMNRITGFFIFLVTLIFVPLSIPIMIAILFNKFVLKKNISISEMFKKIKSKPSKNVAILGE